MTQTPQEELTIDITGVRLDKRLTTQFTYSRSFFEHIFKRKGITINGRPVKKSYKTKTGDILAIESLDRFVDGGILDEAPAIELTVLVEKDDYLIIHKPKGVLSHPNSVRDVNQPSVVGFLYHRYKDLPSIGNFVRAGLVHRLDRETDGCMILAKTERGMAHFKDLFMQKSTANTIEEKEAVPLKKFYRATCDYTEQGQAFLDQSSELPFFIQKDVIPKTPYPQVKHGITKILSYNVIEDTESKQENSGKIEINMEILTGRTHQIRYHLSSEGLPIIGDYLYNPSYDDKDTCPMALTSYQLICQDPDGENIICTI